MAITFLPRRALIVSLFALLFALVTPLQAHAGIVSTDEVVTEQTSTLDREQLLKTLDRDDVQAQLEQYGVDPEQAQERVAAMTDAEVLELQNGLDQAIAAGDGGVVTILLVVIIILLLT